MAWCSSGAPPFSPDFSYPCTLDLVDEKNLQWDEAEVWSYLLRPQRCHWICSLYSLPAVSLVCRGIFLFLQVFTRVGPLDFWVQLDRKRAFYYWVSKFFWRRQIGRDQGISYEDAGTIEFDKPLSKIDRTCCPGEPVCFYSLENGCSYWKCGL